MRDDEKLRHLEFAVGAELEAMGSVLDRLDYRFLRKLGVQLRLIPRPSGDWDFPPSSLQGWVSSYRATKDAIAIARESGLYDVLRKNDKEIRDNLSPRIIPQVDTEIAGDAELEGMISNAKDESTNVMQDLNATLEKAPSPEAVAHVLVVDLTLGQSWDKRPKVDEHVGKRRLAIGSIIGRGALGAALATANMAFGVLAGITTIPAIMGQVPLTVGLVGSAYTGLNAALTAVKDLTDELRK